MMRLDYDISHNIHPYCTGSGGWKYDYIDSEICVWSEELCKDTNEKFDLGLTPGVRIKIEKQLAYDIYGYYSSISGEKHLIGVFGDRHC